MRKERIKIFLKKFSDDLRLKEKTILFQGKEAENLPAVTGSKFISKLS